MHSSHYIIDMISPFNHFLSAWSSGTNKVYTVYSYHHCLLPELLPFLDGNSGPIKHCSLISLSSSRASMSMDSTRLSTYLITRGLQKINGGKSEIKDAYTIVIFLTNLFLLHNIHPWASWRPPSYSWTSKIFVQHKLLFKSHFLWISGIALMLSFE